MDLVEKQDKINQLEEQINVLKKEIEDNDFKSEKQKYLERVSKSEKTKLLIQNYEERLKEIDKKVREYRDGLGYKNIQKEIRQLDKDVLHELSSYQKCDCPRRFQKRFESRQYYTKHICQICNHTYIIQY
jgi:chromosome segregation ATPase